MEESSEKSEAKTDQEVRDSTPEPADHPQTTTAAKSSAQVNDRILETLLNALEDQNLEGFDYLEFRQALRSLTKMDMDEGTRYKSAFAVAQTMQVVPAELVRTAKIYLDVLEKEKRKFADALANQERDQIKGRQDRIHSLDTGIEEKREQIERLMAEIETDRQAADKLRSELEAVHTKIQATQGQFARTWDFLRGEIATDIDNMEKYLK